MTDAAPPKPLAVGVIFPAKKIARLLDVLEEEAGGVRFVLLDLQDPALLGAAASSPSSAELEAAAARLAATYGPLDALLHKLAHDMVFAGLGDVHAAARVQLVKMYVRQNPTVRVVDPFESVQLLTDRRAACEMLQTLLANDCASPDATPLFRIPKFQVVDSQQNFRTLEAAVDAGDTRLPLMCKSVEACGASTALWLWREAEFINHSSRLFKGYVLGDLINVAERRSLPNLVAGAAQRVHFNTQENYPTAKDFHPNADQDSQTINVHARGQDEIFAAVRAIGERLREQLQLSLFGFDVIVADDGAQELYVIDVNYFPSYKELDDLSSQLRKHMKRQCGRQ
ncbi:hypothetical protein BBJ28_00025165 [Nothophytophthora sp. Chile5]|nr:hypothetical protein BBJ28_00025165 [Nothophytophthora sp. Chile5]